MIAATHVLRPRIVIALPEADAEFAQRMLRTVLLVEPDRPAQRAGHFYRALELECRRPVDVPLSRAVNRPAGVRLAVDGVGRRETILGKISRRGGELDRLRRRIPVARRD